MPPTERVVSGRPLEGGVSSPGAQFLPPLTGTGEVEGGQMNEALNLPLPFMPLPPVEGKKTVRPHWNQPRIGQTSPGPPPGAEVLWTKYDSAMSWLGVMDNA